MKHFDRPFLRRQHVGQRASLELATVTGDVNNGMTAALTVAV